MKIISCKILGILLVLLACTNLYAQNPPKVKIVPVAEAWAGNTVNTTVFRKNSLVTFKNTQYIAFYNAEGNVILGKRKVNSSNWTIQKTNYKGNIKDAHNIISIMVDGEGFLHIAWDHHNNKLHYAKSISPGSLNLGAQMEMVGLNEDKLSYPEFYKLNNNKLLFFYRDGGSGNGDLVMNTYDVKTQKWTRLQNNLISGEGKRNAYWQACIDKFGFIHISWVWRESPDVASNHDMAYACSKDGGLTWENSKGVKYQLPITASTAEYALKIPQNHELINQTSMASDENGNPFIATYWRDSDTAIPQYHLIYHIGNEWKTRSLDFRKTSFSLSGGGTKQIPISRPQILVKGKGNNASILLIFRDEERGNKVSALSLKKITDAKWTVSDLNDEDVGSWEPTYDTELWKKAFKLNLFVQRTMQKDGEGLTRTPPQQVNVLEFKPHFK
nr:BNR repeat-containing protein [uncultured Pedobacter sp.]